MSYEHPLMAVIIARCTDDFKWLEFFDWRVSISAGDFWSSSSQLNGEDKGEGAAKVFCGHWQDTRSIDKNIEKAL
jgi:hypothetical protein